jgi:murein DD-endopeptidase MepM/ murein hydrolase activator NlpD
MVGRQGLPLAPHEGVDFCCFENQTGQLVSLSEETLVPVMYNGEVTKIFDDFIGKSILIGHEHHILGARLSSVYGHTRPAAHLQAGSLVAAGEVIAALASGNKNTITPHLHLTVLWAPTALNQKKINWQTLTDPALATLCDPLGYMKHLSASCLTNRDY